MTCMIDLGCVTVLGLPIIAAPRFFVEMFQKEKIVVDFATPAMRYAIFGQLFVPLTIPLNMTYQSIRKAEMASFLSLLRSGLLFIPILFASTAIWGLTGIQFAQPVADVLTAAVSLPIMVRFFRSDPTKEKK